VARRDERERERERETAGYEASRAAQTVERRDAKSGEEVKSGGTRPSP